MDNQKNKLFDDGSKLCMLSFFILGNYFALFGLRNSSKSLKAYSIGDNLTAQKEAKIARNWAIWGLIPSTIINIAIIWWCVVFTLEKLVPIIQQLSQR